MRFSKTGNILKIIFWVFLLVKQIWMEFF